MTQATNHKKVLVLGGRGFVGRHIITQLERQGCTVTCGTRGKQLKLKPNETRTPFQALPDVKSWQTIVQPFDVVINAVGILRPRIKESFDWVHHGTVALLAEACQREQKRFIHVSAMGLENPLHSEFARSKLRGEQAIQRLHANWIIVRASLIEGRDGYGARWFRRVANWPIRFIPKCARGLIAPIHVNDLGEAIARMVVCPTLIQANQIVELAGEYQFTLPQYLAVLAHKPPLISVSVPTWFARLTAFVCDLLHLTPYSFGHHELLQYDNVPDHNRLPELLERPLATPERRSTHSYEAG